jgi:hypothetical protein
LRFAESFRTTALLALLLGGAQAKAGELIVVDSAFAPLEQGSFLFPASRVCPWIDENHRQLPEKGSCFDEAQWKDLEARAPLLRKQLELNRAASAPAYAAWVKALSSMDRAALDAYKLLTHGTRSAWIAWNASGRKAPLITVRNLSSSSALPSSSPKKGAPLSGLRRHANGCALVNWNAEALAGFKSGARLQDYQERLTKLLQQHPKARILSLSLGYNRQWIREDVPGCLPKQVDAEFEALVATWRALLRRFPERLFVVAAGNEASDLAQAKTRADELWAILGDEENLLVVGGLDPQGRPLRVSNFGLPGMTWELGMQVPLRSPLPGTKEGLEAEGYGTSSAAPLAAGRAWSLLEKENMKPVELKRRVLRHPTR